MRNQNDTLVMLNQIKNDLKEFLVSTYEQPHLFDFSIVRYKIIFTSDKHNATYSSHCLALRHRNGNKVIEHAYRHRHDSGYTRSVCINDNVSSSILNSVKVSEEAIINIFNKELESVVKYITDTKNIDKLSVKFILYTDDNNIQPYHTDKCYILPNIS